MQGPAHIFYTVWYQASGNEVGWGCYGNTPGCSLATVWATYRARFCPPCGPPQPPPCWLPKSLHLEVQRTDTQASRTACPIGLIGAGTGDICNHCQRNYTEIWGSLREWCLCLWHISKQKPQQLWQRGAVRIGTYFCIVQPCHQCPVLISLLTQRLHKLYWQWSYSKPPWVKQTCPDLWLIMNQNYKDCIHALSGTSFWTCGTLRGVSSV